MILVEFKDACQLTISLEQERGKCQDNDIVGYIVDSLNKADRLVYSIHLCELHSWKANEGLLYFSFLMTDLSGCCPRPLLVVALLKPKKHQIVCQICLPFN